MKFADEAGIARQAPGRGVADLDVMPGKAKDGDRLAARGGGALGDQDAERFCGIGHGSIIAAPGTFVFDFWITFSPPEASPEGSHAALFMDK
jgi:hypothetical protein